MILKVRNGFVYNQEDGNIVAVISDALSDEIAIEVERTIEFGSEAAPAVEEFIKKVNSGSFKPRAVVKELEEIANRYKD